MKTKLLEEILSDKNLYKAMKAVMVNKGSYGVDGMNCDELEGYVNEHREEIRDKIRRRKYKPLPVRRVQIPKGDGTKRNLGIPSVKDRWIQQAIYQILCPMCEEVFSNLSYGFRPNRSCENAVVKALEYMNDGYDWIVDIDLSKFFDNVNQDILMILVHNIIKDPDTESLIRKVLQSGVLVDGVFHETRKGTPQGGNLSPLLANIYLHELDKELEKRELRFTRYADDIIICVKSELAAKRVMKSIKRWLEEKLRVQVNVTKSKVCKPNEMKYLGFGFYNNKEGWKPKPHIKSIMKLKEKLKEVTKRRWSINIEIRIKRINSILRGWINYFKIGDFNIRMKSIDSWIRFRIRICMWKQWKTPKNRRKNLIKLGVNYEKAYMHSYSRKSYARVASSPIMMTTVTNKVLKDKGLLFGTEYLTKIKTQPQRLSLF